MRIRVALIQDLDFFPSQNPDLGFKILDPAKTEEEEKKGNPPPFHLSSPTNGGPKLTKFI